MSKTVGLELVGKAAQRFVPKQSVDLFLLEDDIPENKADMQVLASFAFHYTCG